MQIAISGDLGSGKSTIGKLVADALGIRYISTGDLHRQIATSRDLSTLQLNRVAEQDSSIDEAVDNSLRELAETREPAVIDSRMAWWFLPEALSVHLIVAPDVGAERVLGRQRDTESYETADEARASVRARAASERTRFTSLYGVDVGRLRNYSAILDTTSVLPDQVVQRIIGFVAERGSFPIDLKPEALWLDPKRILPTERIAVLRYLDAPAVDRVGSIAYLSSNPIEVGHANGTFLAVDGHKRLSAALLRRLPWVPCRLVGENDETIGSGMNVFEALGVLRREPSRIYDWEAAHHTHLGFAE